MIKVEYAEVHGIDNAVRAMRNPMNSWNKSDSGYGYWPNNKDTFELGEQDLALMRRLFKSGPEHRTYARMIQVWMDITAPLYWWKEMDRYTVGKSQVSCSTMHKIAAKEFTKDDFSIDHLRFEFEEDGYRYLATWAEDYFMDTLKYLNRARELYLATKDKKYWWLMIQLLPSSYNQRRTVCMSYETVFKIIRERTGHKLDEWNDFVKKLMTLPYVKDVCEEQK